MGDGGVEVDVWLRGAQHATTRLIRGVIAQPDLWTDDDVRMLLMEMLRAVERETNPRSEPAPVSLRGFNWIVSPFDAGVVVHLELASGTASAGPFAIDGDRLTAMVTRVMSAPQPPGSSVH
jgi:hypothetical protein